MAGARSGGGLRGSGGSGTKACGGGGGGGMKAYDGGDGGWTLSPAFLEQSLERENTPFFLQMMARLCGGVPSPLIEPIIG